MTEKLIKKKYLGKEINGFKIIDELHRDIHGHLFVKAICPCCNQEFVCRLDSITWGKRKSCGCMKTKKGNIIYSPIRYGYSIVYLNNLDSYIIIDKEDVDKVKAHTWTGRIRNSGKIDAFAMIGGKRVYIGDFLMNINVKKGFEVDHVSGETRDNRKCNIRACTKELNLLNTEKGKNVELKIEEIEGKFIVTFSSFVRPKIYDTKEEAERALNKYKQFTYFESQAMRKDIETNQFSIENYCFIGGVLEKIMNEKERNVCKLCLTNLCRDKANNLISEDDFYSEIFKIRELYMELENEKAGKKIA